MHKFGQNRSGVGRGGKYSSPYQMVPSAMLWKCQQCQDLLSKYAWIISLHSDSDFVYKEVFSLFIRSACVEFALTRSRKKKFEKMAQQKAITMDSFYRISYPKGLSTLLKPNYVFQIATFCSYISLQCIVIFIYQ